MKKFFLISILFGVLPLSLAAQTDDLYFVPKKKAKKEVKSTVERIVPEQETYYSGSNRTVEEYNRLESKYEVLDGDSTMRDVITFSAEKGVYPDSLQLDSLNSEDFELTKKLQRFDDYNIADNAAFWAGYERGRYDWMWHSPWYYRTYGWYGGWYDPWYYGRYFGAGWYRWYDSWYDPWYYDWYSPWYYSWYYPYSYGYYGYAGYYGWYYPTYYYGGGGGRHHYASNGVAGTQHHGRIHFNGPRGISNGRTTTHSSGTFGGSSIARASSDRSRFGTSGTRNSNLDARNASGSTRRVTNSNGTFGGARRSSSYSNSGSFGNSSRSSGSYSSSASRSSSSSGGSFGGSRGGGGSIGGSRSGGGGGGGSFGGRRR